MTFARQTAWSRIDGAVKSAVPPAIRDLLCEPETMVVGDINVSGIETLRLWRTRLKNSLRSDADIHGLSALVDRLERLPPGAVLRQYGVESSRSTGVVFFIAPDGPFIGAALVQSVPAIEAV